MRLFVPVMVCALVGAFLPFSVAAASPSNDGLTGQSEAPLSDVSVSHGVWSEIIPPSGRVDHAAVYDPVRDRMIVFGGYQPTLPNYPNDVWALSIDGTPEWIELTPTGTRPNGRVDHTAIYDPVRDRIVIFGGTAGPNQNDVWALSLSGTPEWIELTPTGTPPVARRDHTAIYDSVGDRMIVFGGAGGTYLNDVWSLSLGATPTWTEITPTGTPPDGRWGSTAVYDTTGVRMVVFGGTDGTYLNDVWSLSLGATPTWTEIISDGTPPSGRADHAAVYDPLGNQMVVFAEWDGQIAVTNDVWSLSLGATPTWTEIIPAGTMPSGRWGHTAVYNSHQNEMVVYGGYPNYAHDVWAFSLGGSPGWTELTPTGSAPIGRSFHSAVYDPVRDQMVMTGGYPLFEHDSWVLSLDGDPTWTRLYPTGTPPTGRKNHSAIYDPFRDRVIIFGGFLTYPDNPNLHNSLNDVWVLTLGENPEWTELSPLGTPPSARDAHSAIYDPVRDRIIVFGGYPHYKNDVWELSLSGPPTWTRLFPTGIPPSGRARHTAVYDPVGDRMVIFGGYRIDYSCLNDVWALSLDGTLAWTEIVPAGTPPKARGRHSAIYDSTGERMVIFGAYDCDYYFLNDVWEHSFGSTPTWTELTPAGTLLSVRSGQSAIYDPVRDRMVTFGGTGPFHTNDVWALDWSSSRCPTPEIVSYEPATLTAENCTGSCTVSFVVDTQGDYTDVAMITLEREVTGFWVPEDSVHAPLPAPTWTLTFGVDEHVADGEYVFRAVFHCVNGKVGVSETATVVADRGVASAIRGFEPAQTGLTLGQNVPNPFNPTTRISFVAPGGSRAKLMVYDVEGRHVKTLVDDVIEGGMSETVWDGTDARGNPTSSGIYFYRLIVGNKILTKKMLLLK